MTQPSRTTETINRDNAAIRDIMHQIRELTVPDRATLALGLVGHLATMMNRSQMTKLMGQLQEEAERVQDVPPNRQREDERAASAEPGDDRPAVGPDNSRERMAAEWPGSGAARADSVSAGRNTRPESSTDAKARSEAARNTQPKDSPRAGRQDDRMAAARISDESPPRSRPHGDVLGEQVPASGRGSPEGVGQEGRGEFRSGKLL
ncbi:MAG TPA: hypothetical protein VK912_10665 [Longimicrobiales bacterium]|nr:hypothetical protein [Longimicrobiales bacterium]